MAGEDTKDFDLYIKTLSLKYPTVFKNNNNLTSSLLAFDRNKLKPQPPPLENKNPSGIALNHDEDYMSDPVTNLMQNFYQDKTTGLSKPKIFESKSFNNFTTNKSKQEKQDVELLNFMESYANHGLRPKVDISEYKSIYYKPKWFKEDEEAVTDFFDDMLKIRKLA
jgi:hypothetical protein